MISADEAPLIPVMVTALGRSGTTAIMALLGTDDRVAFDRCYPYEKRCLSYIAKFSLLTATPSDAQRLSPLHLADFDDNHFGPAPWRERSVLMPAPAAWLRESYQLFSRSARQRQPATRYYAEKVSPWVPALVRSVLPARTIHLLRDPRDTWLSARNFARARSTPEHDPSSSSEARTLAHRWLTCAENELADRGRDDAICVRYEDWASDRAAIAARLNRWLGLTLSPDNLDVVRHLSRHRTSASLSGSVARWKRERLPDQVAKHFLAPLGALSDYGYEDVRELAPAPTIRAESRWQHSGDGVWMRDANGSRVIVHGPDTWQELPEAPFSARDVAEVWICAAGDTGDHFGVYFRRPGEAFAEERRMSVPFRPAAHRQILRIPVAQHAAWQGTIEQLRIAVFNGGVEPGRGGMLRWIKLVA